MVELGTSNTQVSVQFRILVSSYFYLLKYSVLSLIKFFVILIKKTNFNFLVTKKVVFLFLFCSDIYISRILYLSYIEIYL